MELFEKLKDKYESLWKAVIRPPRDKYDVKNLGTHPTPTQILTFS